jgi:hypothetical protein
MSLDEIVKGDMGARERCYTCAGTATRIEDKVAPPARPERHGRQRASPKDYFFFCLGSAAAGRAAGAGCGAGAT